MRSQRGAHQRLNFTDDESRNDRDCHGQKTGLTPAQKAERKAAKSRRRRAAKSKAEARPEFDAVTSSQSRDVKDEEDSDVIFVSSSARLSKSSSLF